jgi:hypothetical protein
MALPIQILAGRFPLLLAQLPLLLLDPAQLGNGEDADGGEVHPRRGRNPHSAGRRINAQVDVLDVLANHVHRDLAQRDLRDHQ